MRTVEKEKEGKDINLEFVYVGLSELALQPNKKEEEEEIEEEKKRWLKYNKKCPQINTLKLKTPCKFCVKFGDVLVRRGILLGPLLIG